MNSIYKPMDEQTLSVSMSDIKDGKVMFTFSADCGKFGTDEILDEIEIPVSQLFNLLQNRVN